MIEKGKGGGNTTSGLAFERGRDILSLFKSLPGYSVANSIICFEGKEVAKSLRKNDLYRYLQSEGVDYKKFISKRLLPDEAIYVRRNSTLFVVEMKFQKVAGSVDEKLQTCDFKKKQYKKLMAALNIEVEYLYILSDWFKSPGYKDTLDYVVSVGCRYYFRFPGPVEFGLPMLNS